MLKISLFLCVLVLLAACGKDVSGPYYDECHVYAQDTVLVLPDSTETERAGMICFTELD